MNRCRVGLIVTLLLVATLLPGAATALAVSPVKVTFSFDNNTISEYALAFQKALQPRGVHATFYANSGTLGSSKNFMSWSQLAAVAADGNEIGGKTVHGINLKTTTDRDLKVREVCDDRQAFLAHGMPAFTFAYPGGAFDQTAKDIVTACGYGNARGAGGPSPAGPVFSESLPPLQYLATRAWAPSSMISLANLTSLVNGASTSGGWVQVVIQRVCSQTYDPGSYSACVGSAGSIELDTLTAFLDWVGTAGQAGGAPAGTTIAPVRDVIASVDTAPPSTAIACNAAPCATTPYVGSVDVSLAATDIGAGVAVTRYTLDGSVPTSSSAPYVSAFTLRDTATVSFRSWDAAGNVEPVRSVTVNVARAPDTSPPTTTITCNGNACSTSPYTSAVTVALSATDTGGSGVAATYYTTDGSVPTTSSPNYSGSFKVLQGSTISFFSIDHDGNAEAPRQQRVELTPARVTVSLTWDDGTSSQYALGWQRAMQPHGVLGTFYIVSGDVGGGPIAMTWTQIAGLEGAGNEIGGHTVHHINMKTTTDYQVKVQEVCDDRSALIARGLHPTSFAYPFGAYDATAEEIVQGCGYANARGAGGITVNGPTFGETAPPRDRYGIRAWSTGGQVLLNDLQNMIVTSSANGGGWVPIVLHEVCSQTFAPDRYTACTGTSGWMELDTLNGFLDWMAQAGQPGGSPVGSSIATVRQVMGA